MKAGCAMPPLLLFLLIFLAVLLFLAAAAVVTAYIVYRIAYLRDKTPPDPYDGADRGAVAPFSERVKREISYVLTRDYEDVSIPSDDGLRLHARYLPGDPGAPILLMAHGYRSMFCRDFVGGVAEAVRQGYAALLIDERAHGESEGKTIAFGIRERYDLLSWVGYLNDRFGTERKIVLFGVSMGAATVVMTLGLDLPANVVGAVADCPYSSVQKILENTARGWGLPRKPSWFFARLGAKLFGKFDPAAASPTGAIRQSKLPLLLIHGESDTFVPKPMSDEIYAARPEGTTYATFPGADHGLSYLVDTPRYLALVRDYFENTLHLPVKERNTI